MLIFSQPFWGVICDKTRRTITILKISLVLAGLIALILPVTGNFFVFLIIYATVHFFQGASAPISDTLGIAAANRLGLTFGDFRQYGALGFAAAVFIVSNASGIAGLWIIFPFYCLAFLTAAFSFRQKEEKDISVRVEMLPGLRDLMALPRFRMILICTFFIFGPVVANNNYYSLLFEHVGGSVAGIGLAFLLFSGSEAPVMKLSGKMIRKIGLENTLIFSASVAVLRWAWYSSGPAPGLMIIMFILPGISVGLFIVSAAQYVAENALPQLKTTAMTLYSSAGIGLGGIFCQLIGGILLDLIGIRAVYFFFGLSSLAGLILLIHMKRLKKIEATLL
jgi:MFS transporter, PPP family, 3-phenylpropionic acid transporter